MGMKKIWDGQDLPPEGCEVLIHLAREKVWVPHRVTGYRIAEDLGGNKHLHRIFLKLAASGDRRSSINERPLCDVRPLDWRED